MKKQLLSLALICAAGMTHAQAPAIQWEKSYGGSGYDEAHAIQQTADGGYIVAGRSSSDDGDITFPHGSSDYWVVKADNTGTLQWQKSLGGSNSNIARAIRQTSDGGYIVAGETNSNDGNVTGNHGNYDYWVVKLDNTGTLQWQKSLGGSGADAAYAIQQTTDGGYVIAGYTESNNGNVSGNHGSRDFWIARLDNAGTLQWQKSLGGSNIDEAYAIQQTSEGGYIVAGYTQSTDGDITGYHGTGDCWVVKLDNTGTMEWQKSLGGSSTETGQTIQQTTDGGYIVAGYTTSNNGDVTGNHGSNDYWVVKLDNTGTLQWQKSLGGSGNDVARAIQQTTDGGYIVTGSSNSNDDDVSSNQGGNDYWIVKLDNTGILQWEKSLGGSGADVAYAVQQTTDDGYIVAGYATSNNGDISNSHGGFDYWIVKLEPDVLLPLRLIAFNGSVQDDANLLEWQTADEENLAGFEITRSTDGKTFDKAGFVAADNTGGRHIYTFTDRKPLAGDNFYRLKMTDNDGKYTYSNVVTISTGITKGYSIIYPNPAKENFTLSIGDKSLLGTQVLLTDMKGTIIQSIKITGTLQEISLSGIASGNYLLQLAHGDMLKVVKE